MLVFNPLTFEKAVEILKLGEVLALPTETVYGLAARIDSDSGIKKIFTTKERPFFDPLIVHVSDLPQAKKITTWWPNACDVLAADFWPGPLTMVLPKADAVSDVITSGLPSVGFRMPNHPLALKLIAAVGVPLAAPSANKFGRTSPTSAQHVVEEFANGVPVLDGGACEIGIESTVLLIKPDPLIIDKVLLSILRVGHVGEQDLRRSLEKNKINFEFFLAVSKVESPGHMKHHYMPSVPFILCKSEPQSEEWLRGEILKRLSELPEKIEEVKIVKPIAVHRLVKMELPVSATLAARALYSELRKCASGNADAIYFVEPTGFASEDWAGVRDRVTKAASLVFG
jgi:L-threonylcarbamoyladenylate synthase